VEFLRVIGTVAEKIAPGRDPSFTEAHAVKALEIISSGSVGRVRLSKVLRLGEGVTRTLVKHLKREGLVEVSRSGITLSEFGSKIFSNLRSKISEEVEVKGDALTVGGYNVAILVRNAADTVRHGLEQRDAAIKVGALGATTLVFSQGNLTMPGVSLEVFEKIRPICDELVSKLEPKEKDVIIIGSANDRLSAELGAKTAALKLLL
jgi:hypothetical protein